MQVPCCAGALKAVRRAASAPTALTSTQLPLPSTERSSLTCHTGPGFWLCKEPLMPRVTSGRMGSRCRHS